MKKAEQITLIEPVAAPPQDETLKAWALVEMFGHQRMVGYLTQQNFGAGVLFRVDVPDLMIDGKVTRKGFTRYIALGAIYSITPITESAVRELLPSIDGVPQVRPLSFTDRENY